MRISVVIPAYNEEAVIGDTVRNVRGVLPEAELIVVDDGSDDGTAQKAEKAGACVVRHPYNKGNGAAVRTGLLAATGDIVMMMDGDGQHDAEDIPKFLKLFPEYDMVVGARSSESQAGWFRNLGNCLYNSLASYMTNFKIEDLTSGFRAFKRERILPLVHLFPNGFSYPTTSTLAMLKAGANLKYIPIQAAERVGKSKVRLLYDGSRFFLIILKLVTLFSPMRIFLPVSLLFFTAGLAWAAYTLLHGAFTNMAVLLLIMGSLVFLLGLIAEMLASLYTQGRGEG